MIRFEAEGLSTNGRFIHLPAFCMDKHGHPLIVACARLSAIFGTDVGARRGALRTRFYLGARHDGNRGRCGIKLKISAGEFINCEGVSILVGLWMGKASSMPPQV